ncbi:uncharacterized protein LOC129616659 [Condylostylus longicornis]|uniref:uncharacterized protein LOC129616659 n=1 Tax=Condylostylus longicornis TaxID=2530218 RepID=UPI00244E48A1|nr:uncharacterized protein LOC129616659 [Condylostylus longicornis]XP_055388272.1 uncharacterized protein LOC129616659 [Condylostylus longicornis]XP_055388274.1 uncharacterized protein LOC129616659 [Condylostylus longicornis]XP_055388281.1 uncharacterized protein LOC129616659 [Condylostylus longicornis]XP_055388287.1 uncharacterized protein LOC129616659 [Condylostylus longicornis]XP_055388288.1 uncharacterized protein LOC129616659 [Condylostylus longicornis]XP_055388289.1 uncharacterized prot
MNHRIKDKSSRPLLSQLDTQINDRNNTTSSSTSSSRSSSSSSNSNSIRTFSSSATSTITTKTENCTSTSGTIQSLSNEQIKNELVNINTDVQLKSSSKIKTITKSLLASTKEVATNLNQKLLTVNRITARPNTLNVIAHEQKYVEAKLIICEALNAWRSKARCNVVQGDRLKELFNELQFNPSSKQITEILQTAKFFTRKGDRQLNGLTFGEFCVLAADLKRFRSCNFSSPTNTPPLDSTQAKKTSSSDESTMEDSLKNPNSSPEVFLGGSCNPTTWRADVAIPTLRKLGISFYNPQVSHWTPDLIDLEYRAKEKAQVLFFVMDSETRASAGAIEVAYIAGQNARQLVLVLHAYRPDQCINNEPVSAQEYTDLSRNQQLLKEMVQRRGIPVLDNISEGLKRTKQILAGVCDPPTSISSVLIKIRGAFDRVSTNDFEMTTKNSKSNSIYLPYNGNKITLEQCQLALSFIGYAQSLLKLENLKNILLSYKEPLQLHGIVSPTQSIEQELKTKTQTSPTKNKKLRDIFNVKSNFYNENYINFDEFCIIAAHLSLLQQEIYEHGCISPIKGTNITPPPIFFANMQETSGAENVILRSSSFNNSKRILRTGSFSISSMLSPTLQSYSPTHNLIPASITPVKIVKEKHSTLNERNNSGDSGTSSPQPPLMQEFGTQLTLNSSGSTSCSSCNNFSSNAPTAPLNSKSKFNFGNQVISSRNSGNFDQMLLANQNNNYDSALEDESDSNDSVFSSGSSVNSYLCESKSSFSSVIGKEFCDVYLGGSCFLRTTWRCKIAIPYLNSRGITYHLPALHESIIPSPKLKRWLSEISSKSEEDNTYYDEKLLINLNKNFRSKNTDEELSWPSVIRKNLYNPSLLDSSRILLFVITNETRSLAPMTLAAHCIGLMYNVILCVQMLSENDCYIGNEKLTTTAIKDYNRGRSYLIDLAKRQGVPVFDDIKEALDCVAEKLKASYSRNNLLQNKFLRIL